MLDAPEPIAVAAEELASLADARDASGEPLLDGAFSNFAALNCVSDLIPVAQGLSRLVRPGGQLVLVLFGTIVPGEWIVQLARGSMRAAVRRASRGDVAARIGGHEFVVRYHRAADIERAFAPWFKPIARLGVGVFVPPSAAEPAIHSTLARSAPMLSHCHRASRRA
jgi:SAM-dependent methyltransferase